MNNNNKEEMDEIVMYP